MRPAGATLRVDPPGPGGYRARASRGVLRIERAWIDAPTWRGAPAALPWLGAGIALGAMSLRGLGIEPSSSLALLGLLAAWCSLGVLVGWETLVRVFNRTRIALDDDALRVSHGPLPCAGPPALCVARAEIRGFHVEPSAVGIPRWSVEVETAAGTRSALLELRDRGEALTLRAALAQHLDG